MCTLWGLSPGRLTGYVQRVKPVGSLIRISRRVNFSEYWWRPVHLSMLSYQGFSFIRTKQNRTGILSRHLSIQEGQDGPGSLTWFFFFFFFKDHFFVAFGEEFTRISLCPYSASSPHSLMPCLLTDQKFANSFWKGSPKEHFYEVISKSDQWFERKRHFKN